MNMTMSHEQENGKPLEKKGKRKEGIIRRTESLNVLMTPMEKQIISGKAIKAGLTLSEWVRQSSKKAQVIQRLAPSDLSHFKTLIGLANELSQITRLAHLKGISSLVERCETLMGEIARLIDKLFANDREVK